MCSFKFRSSPTRTRSAFKIISAHICFPCFILSLSHHGFYSGLLLFCIAKAMLFVELSGPPCKCHQKRCHDRCHNGCCRNPAHLQSQPAGPKDGSASAIAAGVVAATPATVPIPLLPSDPLFFGSGCKMINVRIPVTATVSSPERIPEKPKPAMVKSSCLLQDRNH